jgi:sulfiredoxin
VAHLDLNGREPGKTPTPHPLFVEPNAGRRRYPIQVQCDFQIAPMVAQKIFSLPQCLILGWVGHAYGLATNGPDQDEFLCHCCSVARLGRGAVIFELLIQTRLLFVAWQRRLHASITNLSILWHPRQPDRAGRTVDVAFGNNLVQSEASALVGEDTHPMMKRETLSIADVYVPVKRRATLEPKKVQEIAESMLQVGQQTPILVRQDRERFVLIEGLHRLEACKQLGETTIFGYLVQVRPH